MISQFFNNNLAILHSYHNLVHVVQWKIIKKFLTHIDNSFSFTPDMKTASTSFLIHSYKIVSTYINNHILLRNHKIYKEVLPIHSYENYGNEV